MTLVEDVLARHLSFRSLGEDHCLACSDGGPEGEYTPWPCDAYCLAVMVRDIEAECRQTLGHFASMPMSSALASEANTAKRILAITKGDVT